MKTLGEQNNLLTARTTTRTSNKTVTLITSSRFRQSQGVFGEAPCQRTKI